MNTKVIERANEAIKMFKHAAFGVIDENGCLPFQPYLLATLQAFRNYTSPQLWTLTRQNAFKKIATQVSIATITRTI